MKTHSYNSDECELRLILIIVMCVLRLILIILMSVNEDPFL